MPLRVLAAGGSKEEKDRVEAVVRAAFAGRASETWFVSLVKVREQWSVTLDGPGLRAVTLLTAESRIPAELAAALGMAPAPSPAASTPTPGPSAVSTPAAARSAIPPVATGQPPLRALAPPRAATSAPAPARPPAPSRALPPSPALRPPGGAAPRRATPLPSPAPAGAPAPPAAPSVAPARPAAPGGGRGERRDRQSCAQCGDGFIVVYAADDPDEALETVAVACPHCWHINQAMLPASVAYNNEYRAEKP